jgi:acyl carrier protein phosphodiesterase
MCLHGDWSETAFRWIVSMSETTLMNFIQIDFPSDNERELYIALHHQMWSDSLLNRLAEMGLVRKVLTKTWNKDNFRVVNCLEYKDEKSMKSSLELINKEVVQNPLSEKFTMKVVNNRCVVVSEFKA